MFTIFKSNTFCLIVWWISIILVLLLAIIITLMIIKIIRVQTINFCTGKTTNQRLATKAVAEHYTNFDEFAPVEQLLADKEY